MRMTSGCGDRFAGSAITDGLSRVSQAGRVKQESG